MYKHKADKYKQKYQNLKASMSLPVKDPWLFYIQTGKKRVEGRLGMKINLKIGWEM